MKNGRHEALKKFIGVVLFIIYMIIMIYILFFMEWRSRSAGGELRYNAIPFHEIKRYLTNTRTIGLYMVCLNIVGNVVIFMPFGALVTFFMRKSRCVVPKVILISAAFSCAIELTQLFTRVGSCDVDDVILNTLGGFIGSLIYYIHYHRRK